MLEPLDEPGLGLGLGLGPESAICIVPTAVAAWLAVPRNKPMSVKPSIIILCMHHHLALALADGLTLDEALHESPVRTLGFTDGLTLGEALNESFALATSHPCPWTPWIPIRVSA